MGVALPILCYVGLTMAIELIETWRAADANRRTRWRRVWSSRGPRFTLAALMVAGASLAGRALDDHLAQADEVMLYAAVIVAAATWLGRGAAVFASALSVAAYDFLFVEPFFTLSVNEPRHLVTFAGLFALGVFVSSLAERIRRQQSAEVKAALLSTVSHELRTPLATIAGAATTLRAELVGEGARPIPDDERRALLDAIADEAFHLERLVGNLLDMTRVDDGRVTLRREWMPVDELVGSALARTEQRLAPRTVTTTIAPSTPLLYVDVALFERVFVNLLDNVAQHTPSSTRVAIDVRPLPAGGVEIVLSDDGPGMPEGTDAFEKFTRGPSRKSLGLGLAICRAIALAHGGSIEVENTDVNGASRGARFRIVLPPSPAPALAPEPLPGTQ